MNKGSLWYWKAIDEYGTIQRGSFITTTQQQLCMMLSEKKLFLLSAKASRYWFYSCGSAQQKIDLMNQLSVLLNAGIPLAEALDLISEQQAHSGWSALIHYIKLDLSLIHI